MKLLVLQLIFLDSSDGALDFLGGWLLHDPGLFVTAVYMTCRSTKLVVYFSNNFIPSSSSC